jgi:homoserine acetyltransferase
VARDSFYIWFASTGRQVLLDWNDDVRQLQAVISHDITKISNSLLEEAAKTIKAKMLLVIVKQDYTINPILTIKFASMANAQLIEIDSNAGHIELPFGAMREFLEK